jgi:tetratricopeptide (TPR) repeat protein
MADKPSEVWVSRRAMKLEFYALLLVAGSADASGFPPSTQHLADCENRWFLKGTEESNVRMLGFAYVDPTAGVTFEVDGEVATGADGALVRKPNALEGKARIIVRADANFEIACLSDELATQLGLPLVPDWLENYKDSREPGPHNVAWASYFNQIGAFERALACLQLADSAGYASTDLSFERGFALNAMNRFQDAIQALEFAVKQNPNDSGTIGELAFSYMGLRDYKKAIPLYEAALSKDSRRRSGRRAEFAQNISVAFAALGDEKSASKWRKKAAQWKHEIVPGS